MITAYISNNGEIIIPDSVQQAKHWKPGQELVVIETGDGILLKPKSPFKQTKLDDVARCLLYCGKAKTEAEMDAAIAKGVMESQNDCR